MKFYKGVLRKDLDTAIRVYARSNPIEVATLKRMLEEGTLKGF